MTNPKLALLIRVCGLEPVRDRSKERCDYYLDALGQIGHLGSLRTFWERNVRDIQTLKPEHQKQIVELKDTLKVKLTHAKTT